MDKPQLKSFNYYDWGEIGDYLNYKTGKKIRDWANKFSSVPFNSNLPYQDFWHWMIEYYGDALTNGSTLEFNCDDMDDYAYKTKAEDWVIDIIHIIKKEFGTKFNIYVEW